MNPQPDGAGPEDEIELKFALGPEGVERLMGSAVLAALRLKGPRTRVLRSSYYDTPEGDLARVRAALRVRSEDGRFEQTLKALGGTGGHERIEVNTPVDGPAPEPGLLPAEFGVEGWSELRERMLAGALEPLFESRIGRTLWRVGAGEWVVELALDRGLLRAGAGEEPIHELELELERGEAHHLFELALRLLDEIPLRWLGPSKAERGARLAEGRDPQPRAWHPPRIEPDRPGGRHLRDLGFAALEHFLANDHAFRRTGSPEALRGMRGAMRRLRALVGVSRAIDGVEAPVDPARLLGEYRWAIRELRGARDVEALAAEVLDSRRLARLLLETGWWLEGLGG